MPQLTRYNNGVFGWVTPYMNKLHNASIVSIPQHLTGFKPRLRFLKTFKNLENYLKSIDESIDKRNFSL